MSLIIEETVKSKNLDISKFEQDIMMYFHTNFRNVALVTAVSFAALGYSRFYRDKSHLYTSGMILASVLLVLISSILNLLLYNNMKKNINIYSNNNNKNKYSNIKDHLIVNYLFFVIHAILLFFGLYTLYRIVFNKRF